MTGEVHAHIFSKEPSQTCYFHKNQSPGIMLPSTFYFTNIPHNLIPQKMYYMLPKHL